MTTPDETPGVDVDKVTKFPPEVVPVETAIPVFVGYTEKAMDAIPGDLHLKPTRISSLVQYERYFGLPQPEEKVTMAVTVTTANGVPIQYEAVASLEETARSPHVMHYALQMYFANGGGPCWIVSVNPYMSTFGAPLVETELHAGLDAARTQDEATLIVIPEAQSLSIDDFKVLHDAALAQCDERQDRFVIMDVHGGAVSMSAPTSNVLTAVGNFRASGIGANHLKYGAAYAPNIETTLEFRVDETKTDVTITTDGTAAATVKLNTLEAGNTPAYVAARAAIRGMKCRLPPSSAIAGIYAAVDASRGVWKAPANVSVAHVIAPAIQLTNVEQDQMNVDVTGKSINAIRAFTGQGTLVWGARTLAGNDNDWRYVNVRRFCIFVEESVTKATSRFVIEPNDASTWVKVQGMIENFLTTLWRQGALQGAKPEHAFYVAVGLGRTMTALDIQEGRMIVEVGMAVVRPAEFIILRFSHHMAGS